MADTFKLLGQRRDNDTSTHSIYSPPAATEVIVKTLVVANTTAGAATFRFFHHDSGTTYDASTALFYDVSVPANSSMVIPLNICSNVDAANFAIQEGTANALTFSLYGLEVT